MMNVEKLLIYPDRPAYMRGVRKGLRINLAELEGIIEERLPRFRGGVVSDIAPLEERRKRCKHLFFEGLCTAHAARTKKPARRGKAPRRPAAKREHSL